MPVERMSNRNLRVHKYTAHVNVYMKGLPTRAQRLLMHMQIAHAYYWTFVYAHVRTPEPGNGPAQCRQRSSKCVQ